MHLVLDHQRRHGAVELLQSLCSDRGFVPLHLPERLHLTDADREVRAQIDAAVLVLLRHLAVGEAHLGQQVADQVLKFEWVHLMQIGPQFGLHMAALRFDAVADLVES